MKTRFLFKGLIFLLFISSAVSCKKFLDAKPNKQLTLPSTLDDLQALLDNYSEINVGYYPYLSEFLATDLDIIPRFFGNLDLATKDFYLWQASATNDRLRGPWRSINLGVTTTNVVLENIDKAEGGHDVTRKNAIKGAALFLRAYYFYAIAQLYAKPYDASTASTDLGIPIRLESDINVKSQRVSLQQAYDLITNDLKKAAELLPEEVPIKSRPSLAAAYGALAKVYLSMKAYSDAGFYADKYLLLNDDLLNFNDLSVDSPTPFARFNKEVIFQMRSQNFSYFNFPFGGIDVNLYNSFVDGDLRKRAYFTNHSLGVFFKGDYDGMGMFEGHVFSGIVTDEQFLIRAECNARAGKLTEAMNDLNHLVKTRWDKNLTYVNITATDKIDAIKKILTERRKELIRRGTRWTDLRRLQNEPEFAVVPKRVVDGQTYEIPVNSNKYVLKIPQSVINETGMEQNP